MKVRVSATNAAGTTSVLSPATPVVQPATSTLTTQTARKVLARRRVA
jgi:hypothetical protein